jgi:uncharacterized membrane protein YcaP (DUF421 family)
MGKREVGQLGVMDLIISILIAEMVAISVEEVNKSMLLTIIPISFLVLVQIAIAYFSLKLPRLREIIDGKPAMIITNGKLNFKEMIKQRYNLEDLLLQLREKEIKSIEDIEYAILENNGRLSIFKYNENEKKSDIPLPLILDGKPQYDTLKILKKDEKWLNNILNNQKVRLNNIFYAFYKGDKTFIIKRSDINN